MGKYLIQIYADEAQTAAAMADGRGNTMLEGHVAFQQKHADHILGGDALEPTSTATSLRSDGNGGFTVTDGPFLETKEALGGFYLIEAADLDEALTIARDVPGPFGGHEVRPIRVFD